MTMSHRDCSDSGIGGRRQGRLTARAGKLGLEKASRAHPGAHLTSAVIRVQLAFTSSSGSCLRPSPLHALFHVVRMLSSQSSLNDPHTMPTAIAQRPTIPYPTTSTSSTLSETDPANADPKKKYPIKRKRTLDGASDSAESSSHPTRTREGPKKKKANRACASCQKAHLTCDDCTSSCFNLLPWSSPARHAPCRHPRLYLFSSFRAPQWRWYGPSGRCADSPLRTACGALSCPEHSTASC